MARFDAAANPWRAIERGFYVERPGRSVANEIASRIELRPTSTHLIVGGVGSGKTTQLLVARDRLNKLEDVQAIYLDVSIKHDISHIFPGLLLILSGICLSELANDDSSEVVKATAQTFKDWAKEPSSFTQLRVATEELARLREGLSASRQFVLLFDSLDRLFDPLAFAAVAEQDVAAIRRAGLGAVLVGPQRIMYGPDRAVTDRFDYFYHQPSVDTQQDAAGLEFLVKVLRARAGDDILPDECCLRLAGLSGGILRDLITLAQGAGEEAYLNGGDRIEPEHVDAAADTFGRKHMIGLGADELEVLQRVRTKGSFIQTSDKDLGLLITRRVLEYQNGRPRYAVHPTIQPLLEQLAEKP
jgi:hypothetical protein